MGWLDNKHGSYSAEMSDIESFEEKEGRAPRCPKCRKELKWNNLMVAFPNDASFCKRRHQCGAKLIFFND